jgi:predicted enzyme related to lactoylglutathione lyase
MDPIVHFEIGVRNLDSARKFYGETFGWSLQDWNMPDGSVYVGVHTTPIDEKTRMPLKPGAINGGIMKHTKEVKDIKGAIIAANVPSIDEKVKIIIAGGGKVVKEKTDIMGMGYYAYVSDPDGNIIGLWEDMKK